MAYRRFLHTHKTQEPFSVDGIIGIPTSKRVLKASDLMYKKGECELAPIGTVPECGEILSSVNDTHWIDLLNKDWIYLKRDLRSLRMFHQGGPISTDEVMRSLVTSRLKTNDFVWRPGLSRWVRISEVTEFKNQSLPIEEIQLDKKTSEIEGSEYSLMKKTAFKVTKSWEESSPEGSEGESLSQTLGELRLPFL